MLRSIALVSGLLAFVGACGLSHGQLTSYTRIASSGDLMPGTTSTFTSFDDLSIEDGSVVFRASGTNNVLGVYRRPGGSGSLMSIVDTTMLMPGRSVPFSQIQYATQSNGEVAFTGLDSSFLISGVYKRPAGGSLQTVVDVSTPHPSSPGNFIGLNNSSPVLSNGQVGINDTNSGDGVYVASGAGVVRVVERSAIIPGTASQIGPLNLSTGFTFRNGAVGIAANGVGITSAVLREDNGVLTTIAFHGQQAPQSTSNFGLFYDPRFTDQAMFFVATFGTKTGVFAQTQSGLQKVFDSDVSPGIGLSSIFPYFAASGDDCLFTGGSGNSGTGFARLVMVSNFGTNPGTDVRTLLSAGSMFDGKVLQGLYITQFSMWNDTIVFRASFTDGTSGVYTGVVPSPGTGALLAAAAGCSPLRSRRRRASGE